MSDLQRYPLNFSWSKERYCTTRCTLRIVWTQRSQCSTCFPWYLYLYLYLYLYSVDLKSKYYYFQKLKTVCKHKQSFKQLKVFQQINENKSDNLDQSKVFRVSLWIGHCHLCVESYLKIFYLDLWFQVVINCLILCG